MSYTESRAQMAIEGAQAASRGEMRAPSLNKAFCTATASLGVGTSEYKILATCFQLGYESHIEAELKIQGLPNEFDRIQQKLAEVVGV